MAKGKWEIVKWTKRKREPAKWKRENKERMGKGTKKEREAAKWRREKGKAKRR